MQLHYMHVFYGTFVLILGVNDSINNLEHHHLYHHHHRRRHRCHHLHLRHQVTKHKCSVMPEA